jgi:hypothetical protein
MSLAVIRVVLGEVLTDGSFIPMEDLATVFTRDAREVISKCQLSWSVSQFSAQ